jgi:anti-anti-sigma factor
LGSGDVLVAEHQGAHLLKFTGDIRVNLCGALDAHIEKIVSNTCVDDVTIDLLDADGLDSTALGLLAKLSIHCQRDRGFTVKIFCNNVNILRVFDAMGFHEIFTISSKASDSKMNAMLEVLEINSLPMSEIRHQVLDAHQTLAKLNPANDTEFGDLIAALKSDH